MDGLEERLAERLADESLPQPLLWLQEAGGFSYQYRLFAVRRGWLEVEHAGDHEPRRFWIQLRHLATVELCPPEEGVKAMDPRPPSVVAREQNGGRIRAGRA